jgi:hypothetical protein
VDQACVDPVIYERDQSFFQSRLDQYLDGVMRRLFRLLLQRSFRLNLCPVPVRASASGPEQRMGGYRSLVNAYSDRPARG